MKRPSGRKYDELRKIEIDLGISKYAEGSCLIKFGDTHVYCTASVENRVPPWLRNSGSGWVTAEYGMLPRSTSERMRRESSHGKQSGRTQEIQRLIGRSLRSIVDLKKLGEYQIHIDCDVIQADGGTRTASISGAWVALRQSINNLLSSRDLLIDPIIGCIGAVSCGIYENISILDLDYDEDSKAEADANFVLTDYGGIVEVQATAETIPFSQEKYSELYTLAQKGIEEINNIQKKVFEN